MTPSPHATAERRRIAERERRRFEKIVREIHKQYEPHEWMTANEAIEKILFAIRAPKKPKGRRGR